MNSSLVIDSLDGTMANRWLKSMLRSRRAGVDFVRNLRPVHGINNCGGEGRIFSYLPAVFQEVLSFYVSPA